ncbi:HvfC/BufC N-terminal domain-containing protein [Chelatococcus asaccharovorans]|uniref:Putative DNA-binding protein n=1 Tax=Chelatococcus asaccharovorans TaxID=28210 RepID=A0A2V3U4X4_9HYPH|nr:DNA-binding domain-containing protein [Chelatococcus asaccharovorans]MBS7703705.1 putative DNA-binding domain-containing protein [Chelatococcus asaccharovorans]PXW57865.1 putative DNA-binding protein [Chelatococcus asaccharovorans]CAH1668857.1 putative DNA-binding protein [Chelatococcus asaccharovorans]CAH1679723.1 putative DNA-binding protein [Chelatococcus asaccharovorans]
MTALSAFAAALTAPDRRPPPEFAGRAERRFAVYRNNVMVGLIRALETRFPVLVSLLGEEFFRAMAREFTRAHPPSSPVLMSFGDELPDFIGGFEPAEEMPYLADVARIEIARTRAYHAADVPRLGTDAYSELTPSNFEAMLIDLHPAVAVIHSHHPIWTILAMASGWQPAAAIEDWQPQAVLVNRPDLDVLVRPLTTGAALFLEALGAGRPLGIAATEVAQDVPDFDLPAALATLIGDGLATRIHVFGGDLP